MADTTIPEKSGVHLTGADSGWPVGAEDSPGHAKDGTGTDTTLPKAESVAGGFITDAGTDEVQRVTLAGATGGTFTLKSGAKTTAAIAYNAKASAVQSALEALSTIGKGNVSVAGEAGGPYTVTFIGALADENVASLEADGGELEGEGAEVTVATTTAGKPL